MVIIFATQLNPDTTQGTSLSRMMAKNRLLSYWHPAGGGLRERDVRFYVKTGRNDEDILSRKQCHAKN